MNIAVLDEIEEELEERTVTPPAISEGFDLVDGEFREILVNTESSRVSGEIDFALKSCCYRKQPGWVFPEETWFRCFPNEEQRTRRPDTATIALDRMPPATNDREGYCTIVPDLDADDVEGKLKDRLGAGVKAVWVNTIPTRTVRCHRPDGSVRDPHESGMLTAEGVLPGFACPVADLFRHPSQFT